MHWHLDCGGQGGELLCRGRSTWVGSNEQRTSTIFCQSIGKLCRRCCFARTLHAEQEDGRWSLAQVEVATRATQCLRQRTVQNSQHSLASTEAANDLTRTRPLADTLQQECNDGHRNVCADQRGANIGEAGLKIGGTDSPAPRKAAE
jgi:hypothetical protein